MKIIFGTTSKRKVEDLQNICSQLDIKVEILSLDDIGWDLGEIDENGSTVEENSLIKANAIHEFCISHNINYPIITDDAGMFCEALNGEPGVYTARYGDDELALDPSLPKHQCVLKLLRKLNGTSNRKAYYKCAVTCMMPDGSYFQELGKSDGSISEKMPNELKKPYFFSVFILDGTNCPFADLEPDELIGTYRYNAMEKTLKKIK